MTIFHAYDIRGVVPSEFNAEIAYNIARAIVRKLACASMIVGRDARLSSSEIATAFIHGITDQGCSVIDIGLCTTPALLFAGRVHPACAMITASHNPKEYNGIKICGPNAQPISANTGLLQIKAFAEDGAQPLPLHKGLVSHQNILDEFVEFSLRFLKSKKKYKIVVDAGNGVGGLTYDLLKKKTKLLDIIPLYFKPNGNFPNHDANPMKVETLDELQKMVVDQHADLGVALDGDADRCMFIDNKGEIIPADITLALVAHELLMTHPKGIIFHDLRTSKATKEAILSAGGIPKESPVGNTNLKERLRAQQGLFGGELSGHFMSRESLYNENSLYILFNMLNIIERTGKALFDLANPLREKYAKVEELNFHVDEPKQVFERAKLNWKSASISELDGLKFEFSTWWFCMRMSNTEPLLRVVIEANTKDELMQRQSEVQTFLEKKSDRITS